MRLWVEIPCLHDTRSNRGSQPLREAVSWNTSKMKVKHQKLCQPLREAVSWNTYVLAVLAISVVSLFVRLWVEIKEGINIVGDRYVSLFVRLWVEIVLVSAHMGARTSASSWGCELKYIWHAESEGYNCQPLREAVSWNTDIGVRPSLYCVSLFVRLWVEIRLIRKYILQFRCQPLREAVSWN